MKKYVYYLDRKGVNALIEGFTPDGYYNVLDAIKKAQHIFDRTDTVFAIRVYESVPNTRNKQFKWVATVRDGNVVDIIEDGEIVYKKKTADETWFDTFE